MIIITFFNILISKKEYNTIFSFDKSLSEIISENKINTITYDFLYNDVLILENEINNKYAFENNSYDELIKFYISANKIVDKKLSELFDVYNYVLSDDEKQNFIKNYNDFFISINNTISEYELNYNKNDKNKLYKDYIFYKSLYEKRIKECYYIINKYIYVFNS